MAITQNDLNELARTGHIFEIKRDLTGIRQELDRRFTQLLRAIKGEPANRPMNLKEFGAAIGKSKSAVFRMCERGEIEFEQPGGKGTSVYIPRHQLDKYLGNAQDESVVNPFTTH